MKNSAINRWLTLLANVAVFASILFLAIEIGQNQTAIEESNRLSILGAREIEVEQFNEFRSMIVQDPELTRIWSDGIADRELDSLSQTRFDLLCNNIVWMSAGSYERSIALERVDAAAATTAARADYIDGSEIFKSCWLSLRDTLKSYGMTDYVDAVEAQVKSDFVRPE